MEIGDLPAYRVGQIIKRWRKSLGLTQDAFGEKFSTYGPTISKIEIGDTPTRWKTVRRITDAIPVDFVTKEFPLLKLPSSENPPAASAPSEEVSAILEVGDKKDESIDKELESIPPPRTEDQPKMTDPIEDAPPSRPIIDLVNFDPYKDQGISKHDEKDELIELLTMSNVLLFRLLRQRGVYVPTAVSGTLNEISAAVDAIIRRRGFAAVGKRAL